MKPIIKVTTDDGKELYGWLSEPAQKSATIFINIHGTSSNFYCEDFLYPVVDELNNRGVTTLLTNNRGADGLNGWEKGGSAEEIFEECLLDLDSWIAFTISLGYEDIILSGHSLGTEKVVYYMNHGKLRGRVKKAVLLAPADSFGFEYLYMKKMGTDFVDEAKKLVTEAKGDSFISSRYCHAGVLPKTAESFLSFFAPDSELSKTLPFKSGKLPMYAKIDVPVLVIISDNQDDEYTIVPICEALDLMKSENPNTNTVMLSDTDHIFEGKELELAKEISEFIDN